MIMGNIYTKKKKKEKHSTLFPVWKGVRLNILVNILMHLNVFMHNSHPGECLSGWNNEALHMWATVCLFIRLLLPSALGKVCLLVWLPWLPQVWEHSAHGDQSERMQLTGQSTTQLSDSVQMLIRPNWRNRETVWEWDSQLFPLIRRHFHISASW